MEADCQSPHAAGEISHRDEPSLGETGLTVNIDLVANKPFDIDEESHSLLDIGEEQVEDEEKELDLDSVGLSSPLEKESAAKSEEEKGGGNERDGAKHDNGSEAVCNDFGQRSERGRLGIQVESHFLE